MAKVGQSSRVTAVLKLQAEARQYGIVLDREVLFRGLTGSRRWRWDLANLERRVVVEVHGGAWSQGRHVRGRGFADDRWKMNEGQLCGWKVLEFTTDQVDEGLAIRHIRAAFGHTPSALDYLAGAVDLDALDDLEARAETLRRKERIPDGVAYRRAIAERGAEHGQGSGRRAAGRRRRG